MKEEMLKALKCLYLAVQEDIAKDVETKVMNYVAELEEKLKEKEELIDRAFDEWAYDDTKIEEMLEPIIGKEFIEGDSYCVPGTVGCVEKLVEKYKHTVELCGRFASKLYKTRGERNELRKEIEDDNAELDTAWSKVTEYTEAAEKIKGLIDIQKQNGNYNYNEFMYGMLIGLETAYYSLLGEEAEFTEHPLSWLRDNIPKDFVPTVAEGSLD